MFFGYELPDTPFGQTPMPQQPTNPHGPCTPQQPR